MGRTKEWTSHRHHHHRTTIIIIIKSDQRQAIQYKPKTIIFCSPMQHKNLHSHTSHHSLTLFSLPEKKRAGILHMFVDNHNNTMCVQIMMMMIFWLYVLYYLQKNNNKLAGNFNSKKKWANLANYIWVKKQYRFVSTTDSSSITQNIA